MSAILMDISPRSAWRAVYSTILRGIATTFGALATLATLRSAETGYYYHHGLAAAFGADFVNETLAMLHGEVFTDWLSTPLEAQIREIKQCLRSPDFRRTLFKLDVIESPQSWIPDAVAPHEILVYKTDLIFAQVLLRTEMCNTQERVCMPLQKAQHAAVAAALGRSKKSCGDIRLTLGILGEELGISGKHLGQLFRRETGITFRTYLRAVRMLRAAKLITSKMSIAEVAEILGYKDKDDFRRDFCKAMGRSPAAYRREKVVSRAFFP